MSVSWARVGDILELHREPVTIEADAEYRRIGIYSWGKGFLHRPPVPGSEMGSLRYFTFPERALVLSNIQAWEAAVAVSGPGERDHVASNRFLPYVPIDEDQVSVDYLLHYFLSDDGLAALRQASPGTQVRNRTLGQRLFEDAEVPLVDTCSQRRIAKYLDGIVRSQEAMDHATLTFAKQKHRVVNRVLSELEGPLVPVAEILGLQRREVDVETERLYEEIGVRSFGNGLFVKSPVSGADLGEKRVFGIEPGDLVVSNIFAWEGAVAVVDHRHLGKIGSHRFMTWTPLTADADVNYLRFYFASDAGIAQLRAASPGSAGRNRTLSIKNFQGIHIPLPQLPEQHRAVAELSKLTRVTELIRRRAVLNSALLPAARNEVFGALR